MLTRSYKKHLDQGLLKIFIVTYTFRLEFWLVFKGAVHRNKDIAYA